VVILSFVVVAVKIHMGIIHFTKWYRYIAWHVQMSIMCVYVH